VSANIKQRFRSANEQLPSLGAVLSPSWLSGLTVVVVSLVVVVGTVVAAHYNGSSLQLLHDTQIRSSQNVDDNYVTLDDGLSASVLISDIPLFLLWGGVGFIAYNFTMNIIGAFRRVIDLEHELDYVHADRQKLIREAVQRLIFEVVMLIIWFLYIQFTLHKLLPYVVALAYAGSGAFGWLQNTGYIVSSAILLAIGLHLHVISLRLVLLRQRVFRSSTF
jgi:hypothetical protein